MKKYGFLIILIIVAAVITGGIWWYAQSSDEEDVTSISTSSQPTTMYETYSINGYSFLVPNDWIINETGSGQINETKISEVTFRNSNGKMIMAELRCPIETTGYEQHEKTGVKTEDYSKSNNTYNKELSFGQPLSQDVGPYSLVLMRKKGTTDLNDTDSCQLFSNLDWENDSTVNTTFTAIYESVE